MSAPWSIALRLVVLAAACWLCWWITHRFDAEPLAQFSGVAVVSMVVGNWVANGLSRDLRRLRERRKP
jgi:hypothetical protein